jgi:hypothetical protein
MRRRWSLATAAGRAALRCGRGAAPTGPGDENLQQPELDEPLANQKRKKEGRRDLSFTGGSNDTAAARNRGDSKGEWGCARARVMVLRVQREAQELERELK